MVSRIFHFHHKILRKRNLPKHTTGNTENYNFLKTNSEKQSFLHEIADLLLCTL